MDSRARYGPLAAPRHPLLAQAFRRIRRGAFLLPNDRRPHHPNASRRPADAGRRLPAAARGAGRAGLPAGVGRAGRAGGPAQLPGGRLRDRPTRWRRRWRSPPPARARPRRPAVRGRRRRPSQLRLGDAAGAGAAAARPPRRRGPAADALHAGRLGGGVRPRPPHDVADRPAQGGRAAGGGAVPAARGGRRGAPAGGRRAPRDHARALHGGRRDRPRAHRRRRRVPDRPLPARPPPDRGLAVRDLPGAARRQPLALHVPARQRRVPAGRLLARGARPARPGRHLRAAADRGHAAALGRPRPGRRAGRASCLPPRRTGPST